MERIRMSHFGTATSVAVSSLNFAFPPNYGAVL